MSESVGSSPAKRAETNIWRQVLWPRPWWAKLASIGGHGFLILVVIGVVSGHGGKRQQANAAAQACVRWEVAPAASARTQEIDPAEIIRAYNLLHDCFIDKTDGRDLLSAAWDGAREAVLRAGGPPSKTTRPFFTGSSGTDISNFLKAFNALSNSTARISHDELIWASISTMARSLNEQHTSFQSPAVWRISERSGATDTPDVGYRQIYDVDGSLVWEVIPEGSAAKAGLKPGDIVTAVNGNPIYGGTPPPLPKVGEAFQLTVKRGSQQVALALTPEHLKKRLSAQMLDGNVAYVRLYDFLGSLAAFQKENEGELKMLAGQSPSGWILDLRSNPGGRVEVAMYVAEELGLAGDLMTFESRFNWQEPKAPQVDSITTGKPMVILVNESSASGAELTAAGFQDAGLAWIVGMKTRGSANSAFDRLVAGGGLSITADRVFIAGSHRRVDGIGVTPDEIVRLTADGLAAGHDAQLERAIAYLRSKQTSTASR